MRTKNKLLDNTGHCNAVREASTTMIFMVSMYLSYSLWNYSSGITFCKSSLHYYEHSIALVKAFAQLFRNQFNADVSFIQTTI